MNPIADFILNLAAGIPVGQGIRQIPVEVSSRMSETQLYLLAQTMADKRPDEDTGPDPREYHREWAKDNKIPDWLEPKLWESKSGE